MEFFQYKNLKIKNNIYIYIPETFRRLKVPNLILCEILKETSLDSPSSIYFFFFYIELVILI